MDQNFQTSFIPKKPMIEQKTTAPSRPVGFLLIISIFIFLAVALASGGLYLYNGVLAKDLTKMKNDLNLASNGFEQTKIVQLKTLDKRLSASKEILGSHIAVSPIFKTLGDVTLKNIQYTDFSYSLSPDKGNEIQIKMTGQGVGYRSIALQADLLSKNKNFIDPVFSNLALDEKGNVFFELDFSVDSNFVNYEQMLKTVAGNPSEGNLSTLGTTPITN